MKHIDKILYNQKKYFQEKLLSSSIQDRVKKIKSIKYWIKENEGYILNCCLKDYKKPVSEFYATEFNPVLNHIDFTLKNIKKWTAQKSVWTPIQLFGTKSKIIHEPKGVCLIISPWNYPFNLTLNPIISAIAAGNCMMIKPSEHTPNTSLLINEIITSLFQEREVKVIEGNEIEGAYLINLKFDHIFFTGSPAIGKIVMKASSNYLSSMTLELGGKNHTIVDETANIKDAAEKILWSKYVNCGQTCIAVNHVFVHHKIYEAFLKSLVITMRKFFQSDFEYGEIVNYKHYNRLQNILKECLSHSGEVLGESHSALQESLSFPLTVVKDVSINNMVLKQEIFGPILPIVVYNDFQSILDFINMGDKPLAMYFFSRSKKSIKNFIQSTSSGTVAVNECMLQYANPYLPFGGVNNSGIGRTGGKSGFLEFSNQKSVFFQISGFSIAKFIYPPYTLFKKKLAKILR